MDIALVQQKLPRDSMDAFQQGLNSIKEAANAGAKVIAFPELSFTPFYPQIRAEDREEDLLDLAEPVPGPTTDTISDMAKSFGVVVVFNLFERDEETTYNTSVVVDADGTVLGRSRMMHIPQYENFYEQDYYTPGDTGAPVFETAIGKVGVATCYDRHYPEYLRALGLAGAELVIVPQAGVKDEWPHGVYEAELKVGSFQNGYFMAMPNRVGREEHLYFDGRSVVTDPHGRILAQAPANESILVMSAIDLSLCEDAPARKLFLNDRRPDQYVDGAVAQVDPPAPIDKPGDEEAAEDAG
jgi:N-carbamoylputrescine amidase